VLLNTAIVLIVTKLLVKVLCEYLQVKCEDIYICCHFVANPPLRICSVINDGVVKRKNKINETKVTRTICFG